MTKEFRAGSFTALPTKQRAITLTGGFFSMIISMLKQRTCGGVLVNTSRTCRLPLWEKEKRLQIMQPLSLPRSIGLGLAPVVTLARSVRAFSQTEHSYSMTGVPISQFER